MEGPIRVVLVDDSQRTIANLRKLLSFETDIEVAGSAQTARDGLEVVRDLSPDVLVLDVDLADVDGIRALEQFGAEQPRFGLILVSVRQDSQHFGSAEETGVRQYLVKPFAADELVAAIRRASGKEQADPGSGNESKAGAAIREAKRRSKAEASTQIRIASVRAVKDAPSAARATIARQGLQHDPPSAARLAASGMRPAAGPKSTARPQTPDMPTRPMRALPASPRAGGALAPRPAEGPPAARRGGPPAPVEGRSAVMPAHRPGNEEHGLVMPVPPASNDWASAALPVPQPGVDDKSVVMPASHPGAGIHPALAQAGVAATAPRAPARPKAAVPAASPADEVVQAPAVELPPVPPPVHGRAGQGVVTVVVSGKGGVGKTVIAINLAATLVRETGESVALVDLDLQFGDTAVMLGVHPTGTLADVGKAYPKIDTPMVGSMMATAAGGVRLLAAPLSPELADIVSPEHVRATISMLRDAFDHVIVDTGTHFNDVSLEAIELADRVLVVTDLNVPSIKDAKLVFKIFDQIGVSRERVHLVLNRSDAPSEVTVPQLEASLRCHVSVRIPTHGKQVLQSIEKGIPICLMAPESEISVKMRELAGRLVPLADAKETGEKSAIRRFFIRPTS